VQLTKSTPSSTSVRFSAVTLSLDMWKDKKFDSVIVISRIRLLKEAFAHMDVLNLYPIYLLVLHMIIITDGHQPLDVLQE